MDPLEEALISVVGAHLSSESLHSALEDSERLGALRAWCSASLATHHLVEVSSLLAKSLGPDLGAMEALGVPCDLLHKFPDWSTGSREGFRVEAPKVKLPPQGAGVPIHTLKLQLSSSPQTTPYALMLLQDLLQRLDPKVCFVVAVEPGASLEPLQIIIEKLVPGAARRVRFVSLRSATFFAQDNSRPALTLDGEPCLLIPRMFAQRTSRQDDALWPKEAEEQLGLPVRRTPLYWEGGNILHDEENLLIGVDTIVANQRILGLAASEVIALFEEELGGRATLLGDLWAVVFDAQTQRITRSGQAYFHIDMDLSLLGKFGRKRKPRALLADPARGLALRAAVEKHAPLFATQLFPAKQARDLIIGEYASYAEERYQQIMGYSATLQALGYQVSGVPDLRIKYEENLFGTVNLNFSYCNGLPGLHGERPAFYAMRWGIPGLDEAAAACIRRSGVEPIWVNQRPQIANALMLLEGGLHCFAGTLR